MIFRSDRVFSIVRLLEECLVSYRCTLEIEQISSILNRLKELNHHYGLDTIEELLNTCENMYRASLELYDILFPPAPGEQFQISKDQRRNILQFGII